MMLHLPGAASAGEPIFLPGSSWGLVPPPGFVVERQPQSVFTHPAGAVIMVVTSLQPVDPSRFTQVGTVTGQPGSRGQVVATDEVEVGDLPGYVMRIRMLDVAAESITLIVQGRTTGFLSATIFDHARPAVTDDAVLAALLSAVERDRSPAEQLSALPIEFADLTDLRIVGTTPNGVIFTDGPENASRLGTGQHFVSVVTFPPETAGGYRVARDVVAFASHLEGSFRTLRVTTSREVEGANGRHMEVGFHTSQDGVPRGGTGWSFVTGRTMVIVVVEYPSGEEQTSLERFVRLRDGISER